MTTCTPLGLVFPDGSDRPCDVDDTSCLFASGVESYLDNLDAIVQRTATTVPMAWVRTQEAQVIGATDINTYTVPFDTVIADTDNMVDLTAFSGFTIQTRGIYAIGAYARGTVTSAGANQTNNQMIGVYEGPIGLLNHIGTVSAESFTLANGSIVGLSQMVILPLEVGQAHSLQLNASGTAGDFVTYSDTSFWACWLGDIT